MDYKVLYAEANYGTAEIDAVIKVLENQRHNMVASDNVSEFQGKVAALFGKSFGVMSNSGSSANLLALASFGFPEGKNVITPALTFSTTVAPIVQCGLIPNFVDCNISTLQIDEDAIERAINIDSVAIMVPNLIGNLPDWRRIKEIADKHNLVVIEDSADTIGYQLEGVIGNPYTDVVTTSFYASHIITGAGVGGMTCFNEVRLRDKALSLRGWGRRSSQYGETEDISRRLSASLAGMDYDDKYIFDDLGYNFIPSEMSAAFALVQLGSLEENIQIRTRNYAALTDMLSAHSKSIRLFSSANIARTNWLAFPLVLQGSLAGRRRELQIYLEKNGIQTRTIFTGNILRHPALANVNVIGNADDFPNSDQVMKNGILLGCHSRLTLDQVRLMGDTIGTFIAEE
ncbi:aminotransferase class I/II-fold pyridoxal phosphate-dependent enzyme [Alphaproteobacteria bacterium]|nr:aminotransferase class I/II-fold pyridoxal phosphate-dependent enzyme [Alphaproteobacteria bacterium]MDB2393735.1 aminotransferase class I/II-fold pyridoxal phosphate-dependent enzyme [Alphaproteobacteria bacterium]MDB2431929.1 aminotransferase class I/II-fold pyridoxal phosphate-dependent enzyme [Alphaproteobacteria bacterium]MDB2575100.1 aminotransferase class I/II-fold pyridoxal phosphate-dependent enzyme [Alphaproteobacteria bacterium]MDB2656026.1 aminotransferase class I/II-fold pyridox